MEQNESFKDKQKRNKEPLQYALYKGMSGKYGAMRFNLKKAYQDQRRDKSDGCIFLEAAPASGPNIYNWESGKIVMALNITDIPKIILYLRSPNHPIFAKSDGICKIFHDRGAGTKDKGKNKTSLNIGKPAEMDNFFWTLYQVDNGNQKEAKITVSPDEAIVIGTLLQSAITSILAWD